MFLPPNLSPLHVSNTDTDMEPDAGDAPMAEDSAIPMEVFAWDNTEHLQILTP
jgi:hypothetical protein